MMTSLLRQRSGTKVMPVSQNLQPVSRFTRRPNRLSGIGAAAALLQFALIGADFRAIALNPIHL